MLTYLSNFVPISLLVTLEMVKVVQGVMISNDKSMYQAKNDINTTNFQLRCTLKGGCKLPLTHRS